MAKETEEEGETEVTEYNPHFNELLESYNNMLEDSRKVLEKYGELKVSHSKVLKAFGKMKIEKEALEEKFKLIEEEYSMTALITENKKLKATIDKLNYDLGKFVRGEENLNLILGSQRNANDRSGLGFEVESSGTKKNKEVSIGHKKSQDKYQRYYRRPRNHNPNTSSNRTRMNRAISNETTSQEAEPSSSLQPESPEEPKGV
ncbi:protein CROWDED NUCLEI 4-like [Senna tora]|uniref:Protein CROWDED NUCLEI 4-like n=1 Tax=Senna tora TaxID=362788 RepID=A0A834WP90_9FABA|nr:protein CROWDED NUCLEI 4-like [Senna tora]